MRLRAALMAIVILAAWTHPARADDNDEARARAHYEIAQGLARLGDYRGAIKEFAAGYQLSKKPRFLLNIGTMYRKLDDVQRARDFYRQFLDGAAADDPERTQAEEVLKELEEQLRTNPPPPQPDLDAQAQPPPRAVPEPAVVAQAPRRNRRALVGAGIGLGVVGVLGLAGGITSGVLANGTANDLSALDKMHGVFDPSKASLYSTERTLEGVFLGVGAAMTVTGVVLIVVGRR